MSIIILIAASIGSYWLGLANGQETLDRKSSRLLAEEKWKRRIAEYFLECARERARLNEEQAKQANAALFTITMLANTGLIPYPDWRTASRVAWHIARAPIRINGTWYVRAA